MEMNLKNSVTGITVSAVTFVAMFLIVEAYCRATAQTEFFNFTLGSQGWFKKYWKPINKDGYRDVEWDARDTAGKNIIFVVGDSFVAGQGIKKVRDRFSNRLSES